MGLFDHLFKSKSPPSEEDSAEAAGKATEAAKRTEETAKNPPPHRADPSAFLHPKSFVPRGVTPLPVPVKSGAISGVRKPGALPAPPAPGEIVLTLGDVLSRIPTPYLKTGQHDPKREMRFSINDLSSDIARGRAAVPLSRIAQLLPDIFVKEISADEDTEVRLPLQKLVEQIGLLRARPAGGSNDRTPRPAVLPSVVSLSLPLPPPELKMQPESGAAEPMEPLEKDLRDLLGPAEPVIELKPADGAAPAIPVAAENILELKPAAAPLAGEPRAELGSPVPETPLPKAPEVLTPPTTPTIETVARTETAPISPEPAELSRSQEKVQPEILNPAPDPGPSLPVGNATTARPAEAPENRAGEPFAPESPEVAPVQPSAFQSSTSGFMESEASEEKIQLSLAALLRQCPQEIVVGEMPHVPDYVRIALPFAPIDRQLVFGHVEISAVRFVAALPVSYQKYFSARMGVKVPIPLEEIFQNLPSPENEPVAPAGPPPQFLVISLDGPPRAPQIIEETAPASETAEKVAPLSPAGTVLQPLPLEPQWSEPQSVALEPPLPVIEPQSAAIEPQSAALETESPALETESPALESKSSAIDPQSVEIKPQSMAVEPKPIMVDAQVPASEQHSRQVELPSAVIQPAKQETEAPLQEARLSPAGIETSLTENKQSADVAGLLPAVAGLKPADLLTSTEEVKVLPEPAQIPLSPEASGPAAAEDHASAKSSGNLPLPPEAHSGEPSLASAPDVHPDDKPQPLLVAVDFQEGPPTAIDQSTVSPNLPKPHSADSPVGLPPTSVQPDEQAPENSAIFSEQPMASEPKDRSDMDIASAPAAGSAALPLELPAFSNFTPPPPLILAAEATEAAVALSAEGGELIAAEAPPNASVPSEEIPAFLPLDATALLEAVTDENQAEPAETAEKETAPLPKTEGEHQVPTADDFPVTPEIEIDFPPVASSVFGTEAHEDKELPAKSDVAAKSGVSEVVTDTAAPDAKQQPATEKVPDSVVQKAAESPAHAAPSADDDKPINLVLPPQLARPFITLPPPILGFTAKVETEEESSSSESVMAGDQPVVENITEIEKELASVESGVEALGSRAGSGSEQLAETGRPGDVSRRLDVSKESTGVELPAETPAVITIDFAEALAPSEDAESKAIEPAVEMGGLPPATPPDLTMSESPLVKAPAEELDAIEAPATRKLELVQVSGSAEPDASELGLTAGLVGDSAAPEIEKPAPQILESAPAGPIESASNQGAASTPPPAAAKSAATASGGEISNHPAEGVLETEKQWTASGENFAKSGEVAVPPLTIPAIFPIAASESVSVENNPVSTDENAAAASVASTETKTADSVISDPEAKTEKPADGLLLSDESSSASEQPEGVSPDMPANTDAPANPLLLPLPKVHLEPIHTEVVPPPAFPLRRFDQDALQALFMTDENLDLAKISRLAAQLPGVHACVIATRDQACTGGVLPDGFDLAALLGLAPRVGEAAGRLPIGGLKHFTLYGERYSVSFFERNGLSLCAVHRPRSFVPGVREKLVAIADELSKS